MRRKSQAQRRGANTYLLELLPRRLQQHAIEQLVSTGCLNDYMPPEVIPVYDESFVEEPSPEPTSPVYIRFKPAGSNAWPWNKKLPCCGRNEKQCTCGDARYYEVLQ